MSWSTNNHKIAAAFAGLGFRVELNETEIIELDSWRNLRFEVSDTSLTNPKLPSRDDLFRGWMEGTLLQIDNDHPFLCGYYACHNMEALMKMQASGQPYALQLVKGSPLYHYQPGTEDPRLSLSPVRHATVDLPLAAAVGLAGLPVIDLDGEPGRRRYLMPDLLKEMPFQPPKQREWVPVVARDEHGFCHVGKRLEDEVIPLPPAAFFPRIERGKPNLQLGLTHPMHPVVLGYNGAYAYGVLRRKLNELKRRLLIKAPDSDRRALIPLNPSKQLEDEVRQHFQVP